MYRLIQQSPFVLSCKDTLYISRLVNKLKYTNDIVIVTPHWNLEFADGPRDAIKVQASAWLEAGDTEVIGNHPHVTEGMDVYCVHYTGRQKRSYSLLSWKLHMSSGISSDVSRQTILQ